jgi:hypothetical protein
MKFPASRRIRTGKTSYFVDSYQKEENLSRKKWRQEKPSLKIYLMK